MKFIKNMLAALMAAIAIGASAQTVETSPVKWNPGHYIALGGGAGDWMVTDTLKTIAPLPNVRGLLKRYQWRQLETDKGVYNFTPIDEDIAEAQKYGKRLFIMVGTKAFSNGGKAVPDYMYTSTYSGGAYKIEIGGKETIGSKDALGEQMALFDADVRNRLIALVQALGKRYNKNDNFEGITFNETAMGQAVVDLTASQKEAFFDNLQMVDTAARKAFPNTITMQFINFPRQYMRGMVDNGVANSVSIGGPDTFFEDYDLVTYIYPLYDIAAGKVAMGPSVQPENYLTTYKDGPPNPQSVYDLYNYAKNRLHATHMFWTRVADSEDVKPWPSLINMFKSTSFTKDAAGGLNTACPTTFYSCVKKLAP